MNACPICDRPLPKHLAFCRPHWQQLPEDARRQVLLAWRARQARPSPATREAHQAAKDAAAHLIRVAIIMADPDVELVEAHGRAQLVRFALSRPSIGGDLVAAVERLRIGVKTGHELRAAMQVVADTGRPGGHPSQHDPACHRATCTSASGPAGLACAATRHDCERRPGCRWPSEDGGS